MALNVGESGNIYYSLFNHLKDQLVLSGIGSNGVSGTFIEGYPDDDMLRSIRYPDDFQNGDANVSDHIGMPVITFEDASSNLVPIELGSRDRAYRQRFVLTIFARDSLERIRLVEQLLHDLLDKTIYNYDYSSDFDNPSQKNPLLIDPNIAVLPVYDLRGQEQPEIKALRHKVEIVFNVSNK